MSRKKQKTKEQEMLYLLTNERTPMKEQMLQMIYQAVEHNQIGYADVQDPDTGEVIPILIGLELDVNGKVLGGAPLARLFLTQKELQKSYRLPDGAGGYLNLDD